MIQNQLEALKQNLLSWFFSFSPINVRTLTRRQARKDEDVCVRIDGPGGLDRLAYVPLADCESKNRTGNASPSTSGRVATVGYNIAGIKPPFVHLPHPGQLDRLPDDTILVKIHYFSVNYADVTIRWGLYESAIRYCGWPIVPGFDFSGVVDWAGKDSGFEVGDQVFGFTLFGAYSSLLLVPAKQVRKIPQLLGGKAKTLSLESAAALPAVAATALHAISQAGAWPEKIATKNRAALVHSAAGGVGGQLVQMLKEVGFYPIIGVVGSAHKVQFCRDLGCDYVIDKSSTRNLWAEAREVSPDGFAAIFDASGVETLAGSYENLSRCGRLITYGFHSNLPKASSLLSPLEWIRMIYRVAAMPRFDPMSLVLDSKAVLGFNLSFFADEHELVRKYFDQIVEWVIEGKTSVPAVTVVDMKDISRAHELIQSGSTVGKIVMRVSCNAGSM